MIIGRCPTAAERILFRGEKNSTFKVKNTRTHTHVKMVTLQEKTDIT